MTFKAYMKNIQAKTGKSDEDFWALANENGFIENGKIVATHAQLLKWLKSDIGLGHVHANFIITYLRLRTNDPKISDQMKKWAYSTGYQDK
ncbi:MAG TPA: DUF4287 domain-containing protein [Candidatus Nanoarchaeia archaeon]|nr:DUF4287 domain-containing protein [Candidatus Nanoarchaeia archaeon]